VVDRADVGGVVVVMQTGEADLLCDVLFIELDAVSAGGESEVTEEGTGGSGAGHGSKLLQ
jgi:hypothetical protein